MTLENDDKLMRDAAKLITNIRPDNNLWPGIAAAIHDSPPTRRWAPMLAQAAGLLLLVGASSMLTYKLTVSVPQPGAQIANPDLLFEQAAFGDRYSLGPGFQDARLSLANELDIELERLSPESRADIEANLQLIHGAIQELNKALEGEPDNTVLQEHLLRAYRNELALLRRVSGLSRNVMLRNDI